MNDQRITIATIPVSEAAFHCSNHHGVRHTSDSKKSAVPKLVSVTAGAMRTAMQIGERCRATRTKSKSKCTPDIWLNAVCKN